MESQMQLRDPEIFPSEMVLKRALGDPSYTLLAFFFETIAALFISPQKYTSISIQKYTILI